MSTVTIDGIKTNYDVIGNGPPLLMFSPGGFDATIDKWSTLGVYGRIKILDHLSRNFQCIVFDRRETGQSGGRVEKVTWDDYVNQGKGLLDHLGISAAHLLGGCMGCCPVTTFAVKHPDAVLSMILYWPVGGAAYRIKGHGRFATHLELVRSAGLQAVVDLALSCEEGFGKDPCVGPWAPVIRSDPEFAKAFAKMDQQEYEAILVSMPRELIDRDTAPGAAPEDLMKVEIPALIIPGKDAAHATSAARYLEECLPKAEYWDLLPDEQQEENVPPGLIEFLNRNTPTA